MNNGVGKPRRTTIAAVAGAAALACAAVPGLAGAATGSLDTGSAGGIFSGSANAAGSATRDGSPDGVDGSLRELRCGQRAVSPGLSATNTRHLMGRTGPMSFTLTYNTGTKADKIEVFYHGKIRASTGYVTGAGTKQVSVPAGTNNYVTVKVSGPVGGSWSYTVGCPV